MTIQVDKERVSKEFYNTLTPFEQGYTTYFQAEWPHAEIPKSNPYPEGTQKYQDWNDGTQAAVIAAMDVEE